MNARSRILRAGLPVAALFVAACGGGQGPDDTRDEAVHAAAIPIPPPIFPSPIPVTSPSIYAPPQNAVAGNGAGVRFSAGVGGFGPLTYRWHKNGVAIAGTAGAGHTLTINPATPADAATYMVRVTDAYGRTASASATLQVVSGWAQLSGRPILATQAPQQPALVLCGQPHVAYVWNSGGIGYLYVVAFDGIAWKAKGSLLNVSSDALAFEPSIACVGDATGNRWPAVAWSEGNSTSRNVYVKYWDGATWQQAGGVLNIAAGSMAVKPVLRTPPYDATTGNVPAGGIVRRAAVAWIENGRPSVRRWDTNATSPNGAWMQTANSGQIPNAANARDIALKIDLEFGNQYPPVVAWMQEEGAGLRPYAAIHTFNGSIGRWTQLGAPASFGNPGPAALAGRIGVATGKLGPASALAVPLVQWVERDSPYTVRSHYYPGPSYLNLTGLMPWLTYGSFRTTGPVKAASLDGDELPRLSCASGVVPSFGLLVSDAGGFEVRRGACGQGTVGAWIEARPRHGVSLEEASLRMANTSDPVVAGTRLVSGTYELTVWKYFP